MPISYILFDCFNTLIDDFDEAGDESGMRPLAHLPVNHGLYDSEEQFHDDYLEWRRQYWSNGNHDEVHLEDRWQQIFVNRQSRIGKKVETNILIEEMMSLFCEIFPTTIRKSRQVVTTLDQIKNRVPMAVVSNFFLPDFPEFLLKQNKLDHYFDFIIDSAQLMVKKPGQDIYIHALSRAGIKEDRFGEVLFIGDNLRNDVLMPLKLGMQAWYFDRSEERPSVAAPQEIISFKNWKELGILLEKNL